MNRPVSEWRAHLPTALAIIGLIVSAVIWIEVRFGELRDEQSHQEQQIIQAIDRHEEFVSGEHIDLLRSIATSQDDINFRLGVLHGRVLEAE